MIKKLILILVFFLRAITYGQLNELVLEEGSELNIPQGAIIIVDIITVSPSSVLLCDDSSCISAGTIIQGGGGWVIPVELSAFTAKEIGNKVFLTWITGSETNNYGFELQRTNFGDEEANWIKIAFINGAGNSTTPKNYEYSDCNLIGGNKFKYRLKQIDNHGTFRFSDIVEIEVVPEKYELFQNYPNPFNPSTTIRFQLAKAGLVTIKVYDMLGAEITEILNEVRDSGTYEVNFTATNLSSSTYIYRLTSEGFSDNKKMLLLK